MSYVKKVNRLFLKVFIAFIAIIACILNFSGQTASADENSLYLGGFPAGFVLSTKTVEVVGLCEVMTNGGVYSPARDAGLKPGDIINKINGEKVNKVSDINEFISREYKKYEIEYLRNGEHYNCDINPVKDASSGEKRIGILVKDSINGIGTVTYVDRSEKKFASLGHPIADANNNLIEINGGTVCNSIIYDVKKGIRGTPGELKGAFENGKNIGEAKINCSCGVYGQLSNDFDYSKLVRISKGNIENVAIGKAFIYSTVYGKEPMKYEISIVKVDKTNKDNRNFVIKVDDKTLLEKTGGIVQGMSGSPIVQNGKLIGAVTHVFVNDPTRGYGIGIDNMLSSY